MKAESSSVYFLYKNPIFHMGLCITPLAIGADTLKHSLLFCLAFSCIATGTVLLSQAFLRRLPYAFRILCHSLLAALLYIPTAMAARRFFSAEPTFLCLALLSCDMLLTTEQDTFFYTRHLIDVLKRLFFAIAGICVVILLTGILRELLGYGTIWGQAFLSSPPLPAFQKPAAGMILLACACILAERLRSLLQGKSASTIS